MSHQTRPSRRSQRVLTLDAIVHPSQSSRISSSVVPTFRYLLQPEVSWVRTIAKTEWKEHQFTTFVISGPLWLPDRSDHSNPNVYHYAYKGLGTSPTLMAVPTHLFKIVAVVDTETERITKFASFCMPNDDKLKGRGQVNLAHYLVRLSCLEAAAGMYFLSSRELCDHADALTEAVCSKTQGQAHQPFLFAKGDNSAVRKKKATLGKKTLALVHSGTCRSES